MASGEPDAGRRGADARCPRRSRGSASYGQPRRPRARVTLQRTPYARASVGRNAAQATSVEDSGRGPSSHLCGQHQRGAARTPEEDATHHHTRHVASLCAYVLGRRGELCAVAANARFVPLDTTRPDGNNMSTPSSSSPSTVCTLATHAPIHVHTGTRQGLCELPRASRHIPPLNSAVQAPLAPPWVVQQGPGCPGLCWRLARCAEDEG